MPSFQTFTATVREKKFLTEDVLFISFSAPVEFTFQAGQFVTLFLEKGSERKVRSYSILNPPQEKGKVDLCVKIISGGFASDIFQKAQPGDLFQIKGPFGHFLFNPSQNKEHWFIGAGTGLTPFYSMILEHLPKFPEHRFHLLMGFRYLRNVLFREEFLELEKKHSNFSYSLTFSKEESASWQGLRGRVQQHLPENMQGKTFYICGLRELVLETRAALLEKGVSPENIKFERYN